MGRLSVIVDEHLGVPLVVRRDQRPRLPLCDSQRVAVQVELVMVVVRAHPPRRVVLQRGVRRVAHRKRVVPLNEPLVALRVVGRVDHGHDLAQDGPRGRVLRSRQLVGDLHRRLERRRLVAVVGVVQPGDRR